MCIIWKLSNMIIELCIDFMQHIVIIKIKSMFNIPNPLSNKQIIYAIYL